MNVLRCLARAKNVCMSPNQARLARLAQQIRRNWRFCPSRFGGWESHAERGCICQPHPKTDPDSQGGPGPGALHESRVRQYQLAQASTQTNTHGPWLWRTSGTLE